MADTNASTTPAAASTNTPASSADDAMNGAGTAGAAARAADAPAAAPSPVITGIVSRRGGAPRTVIQVKTDHAKPEAAPSSDPKVGDGTVSGQAPSSSTQTGKPASSSAATGETPKDSKDGAGRSADTKAEDDAKEKPTRLAKSWEELQNREAELVAQKKSIADERKAIAAEQERIKKVTELVKAGKKLAAAREMGLDLKELNDEFLKGDTETVEERAERKYRELRAAEEAETKRLAAERVKEETEKARASVAKIYEAIDEEFTAAPDAYQAVRAFKFSREQALQAAAVKLGRMPSEKEAKAAMEAAESWFDEQIRAAGYVKKSEVPTIAPAPAATDKPPQTLTNVRNEVPLVPRNGKRLSVDERFEEAKRLHLTAR